MNSKSMRFALLMIAPVVLAACSSTRSPAPIVERTSKGESRVVESRPPESKPGAAMPVVAHRQMDSHGFYTVKRGDTLLQIALDFGQNYRDLVTWNNLANANDIRVDQVLRVIPPVGAATAVPVAAAVPAVEVRPLAPVVAAIPNKSGPRGEKLPYSDAALADMQKPESAPLIAAAVKSEAKAETKPAERPMEKSTDAAAGADELSVSWTWPTDGKVLAAFDDSRKGIDIGGKPGQEVMAAAAGKVIYANSMRGYGNLVIVKHTNNLLSAYAHNKTILVKEGQNVGKGEKIAEMGNTDADAVKLHFEIRQQGKPVDPSKFLPSR